MSPLYYAFPPEIRQDGAVVIGLEKVTDMEQEIRVLHAGHYAEVEQQFTGREFDPAYEEVYKPLERDGKFVAFTVRHQGKMVGYLQYFIFRNNYCRSVLMAKEDAMYIAPEFRGRNLFLPLVKYAERCLESIGCNCVGMSSRGVSGSTNIGPYFERRGYLPVATYYVKHLGEKDAQAVSTKAA